MITRPRPRPWSRRWASTATSATGSARPAPSSHLGVVRRLTGDYPAAAQALEQALGIYRDLGDRGGEAEALNETGTLHRVSGDLAQAEACHQQALELARAIASSWDEAHALAGLGRCALAAGRTAAGRGPAAAGAGDLPADRRGRGRGPARRTRRPHRGSGEKGQAIQLQICDGDLLPGRVPRPLEQALGRLIEATAASRPSSGQCPQRAGADRCGGRRGDTGRGPGPRAGPGHRRDLADLGGDAEAPTSEGRRPGKREPRAGQGTTPKVLEPAAPSRRRD